MILLASIYRNNRISPCIIRIKHICHILLNFLTLNKYYSIHIEYHCFFLLQLKNKNHSRIHCDLPKGDWKTCHTAQILVVFYCLCYSCRLHSRSIVSIMRYCCVRTLDHKAMCLDCPYQWQQWWLYCNIVFICFLADSPCRTQASDNKCEWRVENGKRVEKTRAQKLETDCDLHFIEWLRVYPLHNQRIYLSISVNAMHWARVMWHSLCVSI